MAHRGFINEVDIESEEAESAAADRSSFSDDSSNTNTVMSALKHHTDRSHPYENPQLPIEQIEKKIQVQDMIVKEDRESCRTTEVKYQKIFISGEEMCGVPHEDLITASKYLIESLQLREKYMKMSHQAFASTANKFLQRYGGEMELGQTEASKKGVYFCKEKSYKESFSSR